ncbi:MAG: hypothetical protein R3E26_02610 [Nitrosomonas sp.]
MSYISGSAERIDSTITPVDDIADHRIITRIGDRTGDSAYS